MPFPVSSAVGSRPAEVRSSCASAGTAPRCFFSMAFQKTGLMWHEVAPLLAEDFTVIVADLPGYGQSSCPADSPDHVSMSKRELAATLVQAMRVVGCDSFAIVGHDRGGRVAYRAALDHAELISRVAVLNVVPTHDVWITPMRASRWLFGRSRCWRSRTNETRLPKPCHSIDDKDFWRAVAYGSPHLVLG